MIEHYVAFKAHPGKQALLHEALATFAREIREQLPGVLELSWGENFHPRSGGQGYTHALYTRLADRETLSAFQVHPVHKKLVPKLDETCESRIAFDYEPVAT